MKKFIDFIKRGFEELNYTYYKQVYWYEGKLCLGYVIVRNHRFFWIPMNRQVAVCCDKEELNTTLNFLQKNCK
jgi:hypothetical protein